MSLLPDAHAAFLTSTATSISNISSPGSSLVGDTHSVSTNSTISTKPCSQLSFGQRNTNGRLHNALLLKNGNQKNFVPCLLSTIACQDGRFLVSRITNTPVSSDAKTEIVREKSNFFLSYRMFRPILLKSRQAAPLLVLHGGPSVPSDYLFPLVDVVPYRTIIFYDQLGCGRSDAPTNPDLYSIENSVDDLEQLIRHLNLRRFHLYGHSFGGILAYEYIKRTVERSLRSTIDNKFSKAIFAATPRSLVLSSTPTSIPLVEENANRLLALISQEVRLEDVCRTEEEADNPSLLYGEIFRRKHQCRTPTVPLPLQEAYANAGQVGVWRGTSAIHDYEATPIMGEAPHADVDVDATVPPALIVRGEYDFVARHCTERWTNGELFSPDDVNEKVIDDCSHHVLLENGKVYGKLIDTFCSEHD